VVNASAHEWEGMRFPIIVTASESNVRLAELAESNLSKASQSIVPTAKRGLATLTWPSVVADRPGDTPRVGPVTRRGRPR